MLLSLSSRLPTVSVWHATSRSFASRKRKKKVYSKEKPKVSRAKAQKRPIVDRALEAGHVMSLKHHNAEILLVPSLHTLDDYPLYRKSLVALLDSFSPTNVCVEYCEDRDLDMYTSAVAEVAANPEKYPKGQGAAKFPNFDGPASQSQDTTFLFNYAYHMRRLYEPVDIPQILTVEGYLDAFSDNAAVKRMMEQGIELERQTKDHINDIPVEELDLYKQFLSVEQGLSDARFYRGEEARKLSFTQFSVFNMLVQLSHAVTWPTPVVKWDSMPMDKVRCDAEHAESLKSIDNARNYYLPDNEFAFEVAKVLIFKRNDYMTQRVWDLAKSCKPNSRIMFVVGAAHAPGIEHTWSQLHAGDAMTIERLAKIKKEVELKPLKYRKDLRWRLKMLPWNQWNCRVITGVSYQQKLVNQYKWRWEVFRSLTPSQRQSIIEKGFF